MSNAVELLAADTDRQVEMFFLDQPIGGGTVRANGRQVTIETTFHWPPESGAEVEGLFFVGFHNRESCNVRASYPGLLHEPIADNNARYTVLLFGARPQLQITTDSGARLSAVSTGPFGDPGRVTGYSLGIVEPGQHPLNFVFRFV